ncbi:hypothetical protein [Aquabacterium sp.]|uniref:hypothetical protein n=1 Tax=Aquabacterium sp. TaxID=1872578 RepID=UPI004037A4BC
MTPNDYPQGLPKEVLEVWERRLLEEIRTAVQGRISDVARGAETPALAAALFDKFGWGICQAARAIGLDGRNLQGEIDMLVRRIDPDFEEHRRARWAAKPAAFNFERSGAD